MPGSCCAKIPNKNQFSTPYLETCACMKDKILVFCDYRLLSSSYTQRFFNNGNCFYCYFLPSGSQVKLHTQIYFLFIEQRNAVILRVIMELYFQYFKPSYSLIVNPLSACKTKSFKDPTATNFSLISIQCQHKVFNLFYHIFLPNFY